MTFVSAEIAGMAELMVLAARQDRMTLMVDRSPCQFRYSLTMWGGELVVEGR